MFLEAHWAEYARIQSSSIRARSVIRSDADDVRLDRLVGRMEAGAPLEAEGVERAVKSYARRERNRKRARGSTEHAFAPVGMVSPEEVLIWKEAWSRFERAFPEQDLQLLVRDETRPQSVPLKGSERTRLSRIRASPGFRAARSMTFPQS